MSEALANLDSALSGDSGNATAYTGQVYLGEIPTPAAKGVIRGKKIDTGKTTTPKTMTIAQAKSLYLTDPKLQTDWKKLLGRFGLSTNDIKARAIWEISVAGASDWYSTSNGQQKITPQQYLTWYVGGQKAKPDLTRQVYNVTPEQVDSDINDVAQKVLGRTITDADKQSEWYTDLVKGITKMAGRGTTTEVKTVKNKKTGKLERRVIQTPEVTKEAITERITSAVEAADPAALERKQNLEFANWAFNKMGGRG